MGSRSNFCQCLDEPLQRLADIADGDLGCVTGCLSDPDWWYPRSFIDPVISKYGEMLQQEVEDADLAHHQARAREVMLADNRIYSEIHDKEKKKPKYAELAALSRESAARFELAAFSPKSKGKGKGKGALMGMVEGRHGITARFNKNHRPSQPVEDGVDIWTVSQAKGHAAAANAPYHAVIDSIAHVNGLEEDAKPIPSMKHTFRIAQKVLNPPKKQPPPNPSPPCQPCSVNRMHPNL